MHKKLLNLILLLSFGIFSCENKETITETTPIELSFDLVDSLDLTILGDPIMASVNNTGTLVSFYDFPSSETIITNTQGDVQNQFSKKEDTPDAYGFKLELPILWGEDRVILIGLKGIFIYDLAGNLIKKIDHAETMGSAGSMSFPGLTAKIISIEGKEHLLTKSFRSRDTYPGEQKFYDTYKAVELVNLETGEMQDFGSFEPESKFLDGMGYVQSDYAPAYDVSSGKLYLSHGSDPRLYIYDFSAKEAKLDTAIHLDIPDFYEVEGLPRSEFSPGSVTINGGTAAIRNIIVQSGRILVHYYPGIDPKIMEEAMGLWNAGQEEEGEALYSKAQAKAKPGIMVFDEKDYSYLGTLDFPAGINKEGFMADKESLYFQRTPDPEVEEDFLRVYKMKLTEK
ncbi:hypothetical protein SAMN04489724_3225 [Algoriphagus locisalis]|uniref:6-bladed beta-propeller protein n=1 Tax=Algoriphagus locisalis TaxID=305507 RepID=A0A1I7CI78_9BACT|nr:hypothetical protein [Algoriphagus locisalis]SFT99126.1 hypothetical protein SAMN04489724_3225 [Algoriphagus locisalis]